MEHKVDWSTDPIVQIEKALNPVVPICALWMSDVLIGANDASDAGLATCLAEIENAQALLGDSCASLYAGFDLQLSPAAIEAAKALSTSLAKLSDRLKALSVPIDRAALADIGAMLRDDIRPKTLAALNAQREMFITTVITRQMVHAQQADEAIKQVHEISKKIFFISINASVEAARVGEQGRGFSMISQEIRTLSQTAKEAVDRLSPSSR